MTDCPQHRCWRCGRLFSDWDAYTRHVNTYCVRRYVEGGAAGLVLGVLLGLLLIGRG